MGKPQDGQIKVCCNSGANIHSNNVHYIEIETLGFESREEWDEATEEQKHEAVVEYWAGLGFPEIYWEE
ncbi:hypothetical protein [Stieleria sp.]|uniref:hypothetical protein n=1 Tax=Stieleria sp. TaxID=2795976 RepID=UPI0035641361